MQEFVVSFAEGKMVSTPKYIAFVIGFLLLTALLVFDNDGYIRFIDDANLWFHEGGHFIFGLFGDTMGLYGGTLMQLLVPIICAVAFWRRESLVSVSVALIWFFENFFDIAIYMADARVQKLPLLIPGGEHDWTNILSRWGVLHLDTTFATILRGIGWLGLCLTLAWTTYLWWQDRRLYSKHTL
ncbi:hypothetical protein ACFLUJ_04735 [Chloroflexota bacterium]